jgi:hypothetical protein
MVGWALVYGRAFVARGAGRWTAGVALVYGGQ